MSIMCLLLFPDINDNPPSFTSNPYHMTTAEDTAVGNVVGTVSATDTDVGDAGINMFQKNIKQVKIIRLIILR